MEWQWLTSVKRRWYQTIALFCAAAILTGSMASCSPGNSVEFTLVSFTVTKAAYQKIADKFTEKWQKEHKQQVFINQSYGASSAQARAVIDGLEADVVALSLGLDIDQIQKAGLIESDWEKRLPNKSVVSKSVVTLVTTPQNPKQIKTWQDLVKPGVKIITANPKSSGLARWNFLALWLATDRPEEFTTQVYKNSIVLAKDAREASDAFFKQGQGDVLITYENEAILVGQKGEPISFTSPAPNISIENPVALVDRNVKKHKNRAVVQAFIEYLFTPEAQAEFAKVGFRPIDLTGKNSNISKLKPIKNLATIDKFGGWTQAQNQFFKNDAFFDQIERQIIQQ
jgi:sulfate/thiosulfate transport system substrate-binding protein